MQISGGFAEWLEAAGHGQILTELRKLQDLYRQSQGLTRGGSYNYATDEQLRSLLDRYDGRLANIREELRRRGA
jgi:hypothetical protein